MKTKLTTALFCLAGLMLSLFTVKGQADSYDSDIMKMQQVNGSLATTNAMFPRIVAQLKQSKPDITDVQWAAMKMDVFDAEVATLNEQLIPVFKKYFTQEDVKAILAFYETTAGKKLAETTPKMMMEQMQITQTWAMGLMGKIKTYLDKQPRDGVPFGIKRPE